MWPGLSQCGGQKQALKAGFQPHRVCVGQAPHSFKEMAESICFRTFRAAGYERWLKIHNLKEAARTLNYLTEHNITEYDVLAKLAASTAVEFEQLSTSIKQYENHMEQVASLKTHIINYAKTRDTYAAYRITGSREKASFRSAHESTKRAFNELGEKRLPTVKTLQTEYVDLLSKKKTAYEDFKRLRKECQELQTVKANVDALLHIEQVQGSRLLLCL